MTDLSTTYMGLALENPVVPSASPLSRDLDNIKKMEDAGAGAVTLYSLFEEQIDREATLLDDILEDQKDRYAEMTDFFPEPDMFRRNEIDYPDLIRKAKAAVDIPIIASLNGYSEGGWTSYAKAFEDAGADAVELNIYYVPTSHRLTGSQVEALYFNILHDVKTQLSIPVAMKLNPYFSSLPHLATVLSRGGADGLVLFNRFYQPDLDIEKLSTRRDLVLSTSEEMRLPLRWIGILYGKTPASLALTSGIHTPEDVVKAMMAGADIANVCSVLLENGIDYIKALTRGVDSWMVRYNYESLDQIKGLLSHKNTPNPAAFERANYVQLIGAQRI
ncbi:MAG: dihydroorotate dehydrogenase-like protein [Anaerolineae bacterium]|nr:dihydroorotate dehydrogenase-like protein [Anaerolineae bacterium]